MFNKIAYKQIVVTELPYSTSIFHIEESKFKAEAKYIMGIAQFVEYAEYVFPKYVIVDKPIPPLQLSFSMVEYIKRCGIDNLQRIGVKKVFVIMSKEQIEATSFNKLFYEIQCFENTEKCLEFIADYELNYGTVKIEKPH